MNARSILPVLLCIALALAALAGAFANEAWGQKRSPRPDKWTEIPAGVIPTEYGELVGVTGDRNSTTLVFRSDKGDLGIVRLTGVRVDKRISVIKRKY